MPQDVGDWITQWSERDSPEGKLTRDGPSVSNCGSVVLALQRQFESFPFFEFFEAAFTMGLVSLVIALLMVAHEFQKVLRFPFRIRQTPFD